MLVKNIYGYPLPISEFGFVAQPNQIFDLPVPVALKYKAYLLPVDAAAAMAAMPQNRHTKEQRDAYLNSTETFQVDPLAAATTTVITADNIAGMIKTSVSDLPQDFQEKILQDDPLLAAIVEDPVEDEESEDVDEVVAEETVVDDTTESPAPRSKRSKSK